MCSQHSLFLYLTRPVCLLISDMLLSLFGGPVQSMPSLSSKVNDFLAPGSFLQSGEMSLQDSEFPQLYVSVLTVPWLSFRDSMLSIPESQLCSDVKPHPLVSLSCILSV